MVAKTICDTCGTTKVGTNASGWYTVEVKRAGVSFEGRVWPFDLCADCGTTFVLGFMKGTDDAEDEEEKDGTQDRATAPG